MRRLLYRTAREPALTSKHSKRTPVLHATRGQTHQEWLLHLHPSQCFKRWTKLHFENLFAFLAMISNWFTQNLNQDYRTFRRLRAWGFSSFEGGRREGETFSRESSGAMICRFCRCTMFVYIACFVCLLAWLFVCFFVSLFVSLSVCQFVCLLVCLFVCLLACLFVCLSVYVYLCLFMFVYGVIISFHMKQMVNRKAGNGESQVPPRKRHAQRSGVYELLPASHRIIYGGSMTICDVNHCLFSCCCLIC